MSVSKRVRFEVFKRDDFTCTYCGRKVPDVTLELDHIVPIVEGGDDDIENLTTACWDCNRGKAGVPLDNKQALTDLADRTERIHEREAQLRAYHAAKDQERARIEGTFDECWDYWFQLWGADELPRWYCVDEGILRRYVKDGFSAAEIKEAMDIAVGKLGRRAAATKYFGGIMRRKAAEAEGRVRTCRLCGKRIVLSREQLDEEAGKELSWIHTACEEEADG